MTGAVRRGLATLLGLLLAVPVASCLKTFLDAWANQLGLPQVPGLPQGTSLSQGPSLKPPPE